jgi:hypothetical protein
MNNKKTEALGAAGWVSGDYADFLELTPEETALVELRIMVSRAARRCREDQRLTQKQVATKIKSTQSRVAKIEAGAADVSLDLMFRGLFAVGGGLADLIPPVPPRNRGKFRSRVAKLS